MFFSLYQTQNQESYESGTPLESNGKKSQVQPFSSVNNPLSSADSEKQADDRQVVFFSFNHIGVRALF